MTLLMVHRANNSILMDEPDESYTDSLLNRREVKLKLPSSYWKVFTPGKGRVTW